MEAAGFESSECTIPHDPELTHFHYRNDAIPCSSVHSLPTEIGADDRISTLPEQVLDTFMHQRRVTCVSQTGDPDGLIFLVEAWGKLPEQFRKAVLMMVHSVVGVEKN